MASFKIGDRIQVKGMMNVSHFIDPQARRAFHPTLIVDQIKDDEDVDERANESSPDSPVPEEDIRRRSSSGKLWTGFPSVAPIDYEEKDQRHPHDNTSDVGTAGAVPPTHDPSVVLDQADQQANSLSFDDGNGQPGPPFNDGPLIYDDINWDKWYTHVCSDGTSRLILIRAEIVVLNGIDTLCLYQTVKGPFGTGTVVREAVM
ncbi:hypothetical protein KI688_004241 [Linnemannia hyalina]|uniref:Uncharacterized protein n=1 Tax=Linnemannia hyalina TaxID=64524 RepID=A0A9P7XNY1_9FUNG|nr:hypothetical protein KI688_004241 [Linnemannia hyalina]